MKKKLALLTTAIMTIAGAVTASAAEGKIVDGRTLVPVRGAFEELGFDVEWNSETSTAYISDEDNFVEITKGLNYIVANDNNITPDVPQQIIDDRFYLPLRAVGESVGANVEWDGATKTAHISYNGRESLVYCGDTFENGNISGDSSEGILKKEVSNLSKDVNYPDYDNEYVKKIYDAGICSPERYKGTYIGFFDNKWVIVFAGSTDSTDDGFLVDVGLSGLDKAANRDVFDEVYREACNDYIGDLISGKIKEVDLNGDGVMTGDEISVVSFFYSKGIRYLNGLVQFDLDSRTLSEIVS